MSVNHKIGDNMESLRGYDSWKTYTPDQDAPDCYCHPQCRDPDNHYAECCGYCSGLGQNKCSLSNEKWGCISDDHDPRCSTHIAAKEQRFCTVCECRQLDIADQCANDSAGG